MKMDTYNEMEFFNSHCSFKISWACKRSNFLTILSLPLPTKDNTMVREFLKYSYCTAVISKKIFGLQNSSKCIYGLYIIISAHSATISAYHSYRNKHFPLTSLPINGRLFLLLVGNFIGRPS